MFGDSGFKCNQGVGIERKIKESNVSANTAKEWLSSLNYIYINTGFVFTKHNSGFNVKVLFVYIFFSRNLPDSSL